MFTPPLTIFTLPKAFTGHTAIIQHNAIQSWIRMEPQPEIFLLGDDLGVAKYAAKYGLKHFPHIARSEQGTPLISSIFREGQALAMTQYVAYVNADIMLNGLTQTVSAENLPEIFLMVGRRKDLTIWEEWDFSTVHWRQKLEELAEREGRWHTCWGIDFFLFPKGVFEEIPCFAVGKVGWDNWMLSSVLNRNIPLIDTTRTVQAFHQEHAYNHLSNGFQESRDGAEAKQNKQFVGAKNFFNILDATHCLEQGKVQAIYQGYQFLEFANFSLEGLCFTHRIAQQAYMQEKYDFCIGKLQELAYHLTENHKLISAEEQKKFKEYQEKYLIPPLTLQQQDRFATPDPVKLHFDSLQPVRTTIKRIDPERMAICTFRQTFAEALGHYSQQDLHHMPDFVLLQWNGTLDAELRSAIDTHDIHIYDSSILTSTVPPLLCCYSHPQTEYHQGHAFQYLLFSLIKLGITHCFVDAVVTAPIWSKKPDPELIRDRWQDICEIYNHLADEESKDIFLRAMKMIETNDPGYMPIVSYGQYQHPKTQCATGDVLCEGGPCDGGTTRTFAEQVGSTGHVYAFEPVSSNHEKCFTNCATYPQITPVHAGLWSQASRFYIKGSGSGARIVPTAEAGTEECQTLALDTFLEQYNARCDVFKLDIEGAEIEALKGAMQTIRTWCPKLHISIYHKNEHYLDIPLMLIRENLGYTFYMGHHGAWCYETVLYAKPPTDRPLTMEEQITEGSFPPDTAPAIKEYLETAMLLTDFFDEHSLEKNGPAYDIVMSLCHKQYCDTFLHAVAEAEKTVLTPLVLEKFAHCQKAVEYMLADFATAYCRHHKLSPKVKQNELDWQALSHQPVPPKTWQAYADADTPTTPVPTLSVIMPSHNKKNEDIRRCIESVLKQTYTDFEFLIMDDCSTDGSYNILKEYADSSDTIRLFRMDHNSYQGICRNVLSQKARGRYLTFIDNDDWVDPDFFAEGMLLMHREKPDIGILTSTQVDLDGRRTPMPTRPLRTEGSGAYIALVEKYFSWGPWGKFYDAHWLSEQSIYFPEYIFHEDGVFLIKVLQASRLCVTSAACGYNYLQTADSSYRPKSFGWRYILTEWTNLGLRHDILPEYGKDAPLQWTIKTYLLPVLAAYVNAGAPLPMTDDNYAVCRRPDILRIIICAYVQLRHDIHTKQTARASQKAALQSVPANQKTALEPVRPKSIPKAQSEIPVIPVIGGGSLVERVLWRILPKRAMIMALRRSGCFDTAYYLAENADVAKKKMDPITHYVHCGAAEGRKPTPWFNSRAYAAQNPDVSAGGLNPFYHYIRFGHAEGRILR